MTRLPRNPAPPVTMTFIEHHPFGGLTGTRARRGLMGGGNWGLGAGQGAGPGGPRSAGRVQSAGSTRTTFRPASRRESRAASDRPLSVISASNRPSLTDRCAITRPYLELSVTR